jgi:glycosyltransferase involved in cell wall biosynthesis
MNFLLVNRVWIVSELYYPEETSTGHFITKIAEGLAAKYPVHVLCSQPTYAVRDQKAPTYEKLEGVFIHRCWGTKYNKDVLLLRLLNMVTITLSMLINAVRCIRAGDCVLVVTNPPVLPFALSLACYLRRSKCILIVHDVYPEVLIAAGISHKCSLLTRSLGWLTTILYDQMIRIVVLGRDMKSLVERNLPAGAQRIVIIPNWADLDFVQPLPRQNNLLLCQMGLEKKFVIQYSGNIGRTHGIEHLMNCAGQMLHESSIHFLIIGFGGKKNWLKQTIKKRKLINTTLMDYRPRSVLPISLSACDVTIISFVHGMAGVSVPSRMYNVMAAGKPIIAVADPDSELVLVVREENIGWVVSPGDIGGLRKVILEAKANPDLLVQMGQRARRAAETKYSFERVKKAYTEMVASIYEETV